MLYQLIELLNVFLRIVNFISVQVSLLRVSSYLHHLCVLHLEVFITLSQLVELSRLLCQEGLQLLIFLAIAVHCFSVNSVHIIY